MARRIWSPVLWVTACIASGFILREAAMSPTHWMLLDVLALAPLALAATAHGAARAIASATADAERQRADVAAVVHDLRAPLMTARAYLDLLAAESLGLLSSDARDAASRAAMAAARAQALATAIGGRRGVVAGQAATPPIELDAVLADVLVSLDAAIREADAVVEVATLPAVRGDREALYRVFANLVENAVKYRKRDGKVPRIVVSASRQGALWRIAVRDWGIGVAREERTRIFESRVRGGNGLDRPGQGIGLATVRTLVREQGGEVALDPEVEDGVCVEVMLPAE